MFCQDNPETDLALDPADWYLATWRELPPLARPEPAPFDLPLCLNRLRKLRVSRYGALREWEDVDVPVSMTRPEAHFWLRAMTENSVHARTSRVVERLTHQTFDGRLSTEQVLSMARSAGRTLPGKLLAPLACFLDPVQILDLLLPATNTPSNRFHGIVERELAHCFSIMLVPYLTPPERARMCERVRPEITPDRWTNTWHTPPPLAFRLAARLGLHTELQAVVNSWRDEADPWLAHLDVILGLGDPKLVELHARRLRCKPASPRQLRGWLAHTGAAGLDWIEELIHERPAGEIAEYVDVLCRVKTPAAAARLLKLKLAGLVPQRVRRWLDENVEQAIAGLVPLACSRGKLADAALDFLRSAHLRGFTSVIEGQLSQAALEAAARIRRVVYRGTDCQAVLPLDDATTPLWLHAGSLDLGGETLPDWLHLPCLPPLTIGDRRLTPAQVHAVVAALKRSKPGTLRAPLKPLLRHLPATELDRFAWEMFEAWRQDGAPEADGWVMTTLGLLADDGTARRLPAVIRRWAEEGHGKRASHALDILAAVRSDAALLELNGLALRGRPCWLRDRARRYLAEAAGARQLTAAQLDDLLVPDLGLDAHGGRDFDLGSRRFRALLGPGLRPVVRDESGRLRDDLPRPRKDDDPDRAAAARQQWAAFKKQVRETARLQSARLERSLVNGWRWTVETFKERVTGRPLLAALARQLLWGHFNSRGQLIDSFRITEDGTWADEQDRDLPHQPTSGPLVATGNAMGLVHPIHLTAPQRSAWSEVFSDYKLVPPFPQLGRPVYRLEPGETGRELHRFRGVRVSDLAILSVLVDSGYQSHWHGLSGRLRYFPGPDVTAAIGLSGWSGKNIDFVCFFRGNVDERARLNRADAMPLGEVDPLVFSEVLADAARLAGRGTVTATA